MEDFCKAQDDVQPANTQNHTLICRPDLLPSLACSYLGADCWRDTGKLSMTVVLDANKYCKHDGPRKLIECFMTSRRFDREC